MGRTQTQTYDANGIPGCVKQVHSRATGQLVGLYHAAQAGMTADAPWVTVCETHGTMASYQSLRSANAHLPAGAWCEACMQAPPPAPTPIKEGMIRRPGAGRRSSRLVLVSGGANIRMGKELYEGMGRPEWIQAAWNGHDVILRPAAKPAKLGQGIYKVERFSLTGGGINPAAFLAEYSIANGRYKPTLHGTTVRFTPDHQDAAEDGGV